MVLEVVKYGDPVLREKGARVEKITPEIRQFIRDMYDTMYDAKGVGLAAQQVGRALQITVLDVREATDRPSTLEINGKAVDVAAHMPMALVNPVIRAQGEAAKGPEGCLSFPEMYAEITRPEFVEVEALDGEGRAVKFRAGGLLSRAVQHEVDHLNGILFIDRMTSDTRQELKPDLEALQAATKKRLRKQK
ncbi:MAG TPA: peptide deformylase [Methylomirabilota bacterium]|nr:peptide deformylase [Methylomirabilota bacterium]